MPLISRRAVLGAGALGAGAAMLPKAHAAAPLRLHFKLHAWFFSKEAHVSPPVDPHVFVVDPRAPAAVGPQGIHHVAGFRPALYFGPHDIGAYNALGKPLGFTVAEWFAAFGVVSIVRAGAGSRVACRFLHLRPNGVYSLFENHFDLKPVGFTPLDGAGTRNNFIADANGQAAIVVETPAPMTHENAVLLVYHSDNRSHGMERGELGVTAHHQLIARLPA